MEVNAYFELSQEEMHQVNGGSELTQNVFEFLGRVARAFVDGHAAADYSGMAFL